MEIVLKTRTGSEENLAPQFYPLLTVPRAKTSSCSKRSTEKYASPSPLYTICKENKEEQENHQPSGLQNRGGKHSSPVAKYSLPENDTMRPSSQKDSNRGLERWLSG